MSTTKASDRALKAALLQTFNRMRHVDQAAEGMRRALLVFGISAAVLLPLTQPPPSDPNRDRKPSNISIDVKPEVKVITVPVPDPVFVTVDGVNVPPPEVTIVLDEVQLLSMPPASKQWHRARFNRIGDAFWAVPSLDLELVLDSLTGPCTRTECNAHLLFEGPGFNVDKLRLAVDGMAIHALESGPGRCRPVRPDHSYYLECAIYRKKDRGTAATPDLCMQIRRSEVLEKDGQENAALDIRWKEVNWNPTPAEAEAEEQQQEEKPPFNFADIGVTSYSDDYDPQTHGRDAGWFDSLCHFERF